MTINKFLNSAKKITIGSVLAGSLLFNPLSANAQDFPENNNKRDYEEKALMASYVLLNVIDAYQTANMSKNCKELNPLISSWAGDRPSLGELALFKTAWLGGTFYLYNQLPKDKENEKLRKTLLYLANSIQLSVDLQNEKVSGGILFRKSF